MTLEMLLTFQLNHPNIVGYKNAWLEPYVGDHYSSSDGTRNITNICFTFNLKRHLGSTNNFNLKQCCGFFVVIY